MAETTECDYCEAEFPMQDRWVAAMRRPSDPSELVAVMWACPPCGEANGLQSPEVIDAIERGIEDGEAVPGYEGIYFITV
jgi:hypothetical protein